MRVEAKWDGKRRVWAARVYLGREKGTGRKICPSKSFPAARDRAEAQAMAETWASSLTAGGRVRSALLNDLLAGYIDMRERNGASPNSVTSYRSYLRRHIAPAFAGAVAADLTPLDFNGFEQSLLMPRDEGGKGLSRTTVNNIHQFLRGAYKHLVKSGVVGSNPLVDVEAPKPERREARALGEYDFGACNEALTAALADPALGWRGTCLAFAAWLALHTGMRRGEVLAVRVRDVAFSLGYVHVGGTVQEQPRKKPWRRGETKGHRGRNVSLTPGELDVVRGYLARREAEAGPAAGDSPLVTEDGSWMRPSAVSRAFSAFSREHGLGITFHALRHTHATWLLASGVDVKTVSERLGHSDPAITLRVYAHVMPGRDRAAAERFAMAASGASAGVPNPSQRAVPGTGGEGGGNAS